MTILVCYHFGTYRTFKDYYLCCIRGSMRDCFPYAVSYNCFVELAPRVFLSMMLFMRLHAFGKCTGITFVDSTMIPVCNNVMRYFNKVFADRGTSRKNECCEWEDIKKTAKLQRLNCLLWSHLGLNQGPPDYESDALTN